MREIAALTAGATSAMAHASTIRRTLASSVALVGVCLLGWLAATAQGLSPLEPYKSYVWARGRSGPDPRHLGTLTGEPRKIRGLEWRSFQMPEFVRGQALRFCSPWQAPSPWETLLQTGSEYDYRLSQRSLRPSPGSEHLLLFEHAGETNVRSVQVYALGEELPPQLVWACGVDGPGRTTVLVGSHRSHPEIVFVNVAARVSPGPPDPGLEGLLVARHDPSRDEYVPVRPWWPGRLRIAAQFLWQAPRSHWPVQAEISGCVLGALVVLPWIRAALGLVRRQPRGDRP